MVSQHYTVYSRAFRYLNHIFRGRRTATADAARMCVHIYQHVFRFLSCDDAFIKAHPVYGYKLLEPQNIDERIKLAAKEHHERFNGSGYPDNLEGHNISEFARIIAIVDVFDAMTSNRVYRHGICPFQVLSSLESNMECYDPAILLTALERIADMYTNCDVYINNEIKGRVVLINRQDIGRPMVMTEDGRVIDISKERSYSITSLR